MDSITAKKRAFFWGENDHCPWMKTWHLWTPRLPKDGVLPLIETGEPQLHFDSFHMVGFWYAKPRVCLVGIIQFIQENKQQHSGNSTKIAKTMVWKMYLLSQKASFLGICAKFPGCLPFDSMGIFGNFLFDHGFQKGFYGIENLGVFVQVCICSLSQS